MNKRSFSLTGVYYPPQQEQPYPPDTKAVPVAQQQSVSLITITTYNFLFLV